MQQLGAVERKVLGAMLILADKDNYVTATLKQISNAMGYKASGGIVTYAIKALEWSNHIVIVDKNKYRLLV